MGGSKVNKACDECCMKCLMIHGKKDSSSIITSFFKVILGDSISKALLIPPSFAKTIPSLVDVNTYLEDSTRQRWKVRVCSLGGSVAFQQGWHEFASDHCLESGDFVAFHYISGSHFVVQVYGKSGCEKLKFTTNNNGMGKISNNSCHSLPSNGRKSTSTTEGLFPSNDKGSMMNDRGSYSATHLDSDTEMTESRFNVPYAKKPPTITEKRSDGDNSSARPKPVLPTDYDEVPFYMYNRDSIVEQGAYRSPFCDLSAYETLNSKSGADGIKKFPVVTTKERSPHYNANTVQPQTTQGLYDRCNTVDEELGKNDITGSFNKNVTGNGDKSKEQLGKNPHSEQLNRTFSGLAGKDSTLHMKNIALSRSHEPFTSFSEEMPGSRKKLTTDGNNLSGRKLRTVKEELVEMIKENNGKKPVTVKPEPGERVTPVEVQGKVRKGVKTENIEFAGSSSFFLSNNRCSVSRDTQSYLELPTDFTAFSSSGKTKMERKLVLLRDPDMRKWPVFYHEQPGFKVIVSGWEALAKSNNIKQGDELVFEVENESEGLFNVSISRK